MNINKIDLLKREGECLIYDNDDKRLDIRFSPEILRIKREPDSSESIQTELLSWLKSFNERIQKIRSAYSLNTEIYLDDQNEDMLISNIYKIISKSYSVIVAEIDKIKDDYKLSDNWDLSIRSALAFNVLLIPPDLHIFLNFPDKLKNNEQNKHKTLLSVVNDPAIRRVQKALDLVSKPGIYFNRVTSCDELKKWIDKNSKYIRAMQIGMPTNQTLRSERMSLFWGKIAWIWLSDGVKSWADMARKVEKDTDKYVLEHGEAGNEEILIPPDGIALEKYYTRFLSYLKKIDTSTT